MSKDAHFSSDFEAAEMHRRSHGDAWAERLASMALALVLGIGLIVFYNSRRVIPDQLGLGPCFLLRAPLRSWPVAPPLRPSIGTRPRSRRRIRPPTIAWYLNAPGRW